MDREDEDVMKHEMISNYCYYHLFWYGEEERGGLAHN